MSISDKLVVVAMVAAAIAFSCVCADPDMLQDVCVADLNSAVKVNGFPCKQNAMASDFTFAGLAKPGNTYNPVGSNVTQANVMQIPGLNTLGVSMARIDFAVGGENPPHTHPRATEILFLMQGELEVGFITTADVLITTTIKQGEVFVFPKALVHFQLNIGKIPAVAIVGFNSQLAGTQVIANSLFAASPPVPDYVLAKAFRIDNKEVEDIKAKFAAGK